MEVTKLLKWLTTQRIEFSVEYEEDGDIVIGFRSWLVIYDIHHTDERLTLVSAEGAGSTGFYMTAEQVEAKVCGIN